jgi:hypothetical protein
MDTPVSKVVRASYLSAAVMTAFVVWYGLAGFGGTIA